MNVTPRLTLAGLAAALVVAGAAGCNRYDDRPAEWGYLSPAVFQPNCATTSCHSPAAAVSGLDFSTPENGYASLTSLWVWIVVPPDAGTIIAPGTPCAVREGTKVCEQMTRPLVTPYDPAGSRVVNMLRARNAPRMPPDRPLPEADIELVERWILNGAFEYPNGQPAGADATVPLDGGRTGTDAGHDAGHHDASHLDAKVVSDGARDSGGG